MRVVVLHGAGETPQYFWYPWLKKELTKQDINVEIPQLPNTDNPKLAEQLEFCLQNLKLDEDTTVITHSSGTPLAFAILEQIPNEIHKLISVAGYFMPLSAVPNDTKNIRDTYDWQKIKEHCENFVFINSDNDPWGANTEQGIAMQKNLGGQLIVNHEGHMGSETYNQPYKQFPELLKLI